MVALPVRQRFHRLQKSVEAYCRQTHRNRELVIVLDQGSAETKTAIAAYVSSLGRSDVQVVDSPGKLSLGALRNLSRETARGDILCQWDDDDLHHPLRVERQLHALIESGSDAVCLEETMHFFADTRSLWCINWRATEPKGLPGTLLCKRSAPIRYPDTGPSSRLGEDTSVSLQFQQRGSLHALAGAPHLYVYVSHGKNSWGEEHHRMLATKLGLSKALLRKRESQLREGLAPFDFGPGEITVEGYNGPAFEIAPRS